MCGIAGFVSTQPLVSPEAIVARMTNAIRHRGPNAETFYCDAHAALGHRRLSIIDVAGGQQPMFNEAGNLAIIYNGEVFNHASLRPELEAAGHQYKTRCDTETILHAYEQYGPDSVTRFRGMFSYVIWDRDTRTLFAARDRLGLKPFYYYFDGRIFAFASEIKALFKHPAISPAFDDSALSEYIAFGYRSGQDTMFRNIHKLMPGHHLRLRVDEPDPQLDIRQYWDVPLENAPAEDRDESSWIAECRQRLEETVRMRLMSDVPLGMFLSGGVDSSAIAALMKRMFTGPVKTFAVGYQEAEYSELAYARQVAQSIGTEHHEVVIGMDDFFNALPNLIWHEDEPIVWPSSVSLYFVSQLAAQEVKVVLTGEGSDELFAGYGRYQHYLSQSRMLGMYRMVPSPLRGLVRGQIGSSSLISGELRRKLQHTFLGRNENLESLYLDNFYSAFSSVEQQDLFRLPPGPSAYEAYLSYWNKAGGDASLLRHMLYSDQKTYLVELLMKQDQMSMACSIESRVPFLDHTFVEFATRVPESLKVRNGTGKYILKRAVEDLLPHDIIYRKKMGFPTPLRQWLSGPEAEGLLGLLTNPEGLLAPYVNGRKLDTLLTRHRSGQEDATDRIWRLLNLQIWGDMFLTGNRERWSNGMMAEQAAV
jgi:asparagine synthase (glutamine-hydrolysing)